MARGGATAWRRAPPAGSVRARARAGLGQAMMRPSRALAALALASALASALPRAALAGEPFMDAIASPCKCERLEEDKVECPAGRVMRGLETGRQLGVPYGPAECCELCVNAAHHETGEDAPTWTTVTVDTEGCDDEFQILDSPWECADGTFLVAFTGTQQFGEVTLPTLPARCCPLRASGVTAAGLQMSRTLGTCGCYWDEEATCQGLAPLGTSLPSALVAGFKYVVEMEASESTYIPHLPTRCCYACEPHASPFPRAWLSSEWALALVVLAGFVLGCCARLFVCAPSARRGARGGGSAHTPLLNIETHRGLLDSSDSSDDSSEEEDSDDEGGEQGSEEGEGEREGEGEGEGADGGEEGADSGSDGADTNFDAGGSAAEASDEEVEEHAERAIDIEQGAVPSESDADKDVSIPMPDKAAGAASGGNELLRGTECVVCMAKPVQVVCVPCGHACMCKKCGKRVPTCPVCRVDILRRQKLFIG